MTTPKSECSNNKIAPHYQVLIPFILIIYRSRSLWLNLHNGAIFYNLTFYALIKYNTLQLSTLNGPNHITLSWKLCVIVIRKLNVLLYLQNIFSFNATSKKNIYHDFLTQKDKIELSKIKSTCTQKLSAINGYSAKGMLA